MFITLVVFLVGVAYIDGLSLQVLPVHLIYGHISAVEVIKGDEAIVLRLVSFWVSHDLGRNYDAKLVEDITEHLLVDVFSEVSNKDVGSHLLGSFILTCFVNLDRLLEELYHVQDLDGVVGVFFRFKLYESVRLVLICNFISRNVHINYGPSL